MKLEISMHDKKILLMFFGVVIFVAGYMFGYRPQMEKAETFQAQSVPVREHLNKLLEMAEKKDFYVKETSSMKKKIEDYTAQFPADVKEEDGIILAYNMEKSLDMNASSVGLGTKDFVASMNGRSQSDIEEEQQTLSEKGNEQTQENIDEIEGTDTDAEKQQEAVDGAARQTDPATPVLYRTQDDLQISITYASLKEMVEYLAAQNGRTTIDSVNASFDPTTGNLTGTLTVNLFSMTGTSNSYTEPDAGSVAHGTGNLFGTIENTEATK